ncbi:hypothetical protein ABKN59_004727 [Abortiporus biennis]
MNLKVYLTSIVLLDCWEPTASIWVVCVPSTVSCTVIPFSWRVEVRSSFLTVLSPGLQTTATKEILRTLTLPNRQE